MLNPRQLTIVNAVPVDSSGAVRATRVENCGESAMTSIPQINKYNRNIAGWNMGIKGENKQHRPDPSNAPKATRALPFRSARNPPTAQDIAPTPMIRNDHSDTERLALCVSLKYSNMTGTNVQNAYSSHMCPK